MQNTFRNNYNNNNRTIKSNLVHSQCSSRDHQHRPRRSHKSLSLAHPPYLTNTHAPFHFFNFFLLTFGVRSSSCATGCEKTEFRIRVSKKNVSWWRYPGHSEEMGTRYCCRCGSCVIAGWLNTNQFVWRGCVERLVPPVRLG